MDDALRLRALKPVCIDMAHHIVTDDLLPGFGIRVIDIIPVRLHLGDLLVRDIQAQLLLCLRQGDPQSPPGPELHVLGKYVLHLPAGIALG